MVLIFICLKLVLIFDIAAPFKNLLYLLLAIHWFYANSLEATVHDTPKQMSHTGHTFLPFSVLSFFLSYFFESIGIGLEKFGLKKVSVSV